MYLVIQLWTAEDFIKEEVYLSISMEETGKQDYKELVWWRFLQPHPKYYDSVHEMRDLLRSLTGFLAQDESLFVNSRGAKQQEE